MSSENQEYNIHDAFVDRIRALTDTIQEHCVCADENNATVAFAAKDIEDTVWEYVYGEAHWPEYSCLQDSYYRRYKNDVGPYSIEEEEPELFDALQFFSSLDRNVITDDELQRKEEAISTIMEFGQGYSFVEVPPVRNAYDDGSFVKKRKKHSNLSAWRQHHREAVAETHNSALDW